MRLPRWIQRLTRKGRYNLNRCDKIVALKAEITELSAQMQRRLLAGAPFPDLLLQAQTISDGFTWHDPAFNDEINGEMARVGVKVNNWLKEVREVSILGVGNTTVHRAYQCTEHKYSIGGPMMSYAPWAASREAAHALKPHHWARDIDKPENPDFTESIGIESKDAVTILDFAQYNPYS